MNLPEYFRLQLRLEGREIVNGNQLRQVKIVPDGDMPLMIVVQFADGNVITDYDEALPSDLRKALAKRVRNLMFPKIDLLLDHLKKQSVSFDVGHHKTYLFPEHIVDSIHDDVRCLSGQDSLVQEFGFGDFAEQVYVVEQNGKIVSACVSILENAQCAEAWVYTDENYRKQGSAQLVVHAWARDMFKAGKIPFYSHKIQNTASANLARRLRLRPIFEEVAISYAKDE